MDLRELKALDLAARAQITFANGFWVVPSQTSPSTSYRVTIAPPSCECDDFRLRQEPCKHVIAARLVCERNGGAQAPALDTDAVPNKPTYRQDWPWFRSRKRWASCPSSGKRRTRTVCTLFCQWCERNALERGATHWSGFRRLRCKAV
ncbi:MAG: SWIM zinc finger domain-containing protein [Gemmataceae bacterium]|nr:SWIM zinc finger domain-containing protein [Gemmataceae bacterium]